MNLLDLSSDEDRAAIEGFATVLAGLIRMQRRAGMSIKEIEDRYKHEMDGADGIMGNAGRDAVWKRAVELTGR